MRSSRTHRHLVLPAAVGSLLLLGACSAGENLDDAADGADPTTTEEPGATESPEATEAPDDGADDDGAGDAAGAEGAACLEGDWAVDVDAVLEAALSAPGLAELDPDVDVSGEQTVTFADGTFTTEYDDQTTTLRWDMEGQEVESVTSYDGRLSAEYEATDSELTVTELDTSEVDLTSTTTINGEELDLGTEGMVKDALAMEGTSTYECTDTELRLTPKVEGTDTSAFVTVLTRR